MASVARYENLIVRNSRVVLGVSGLFSIASWLMAPCFLILAGTEVFPLNRLSFDRGIGALSGLCAAYFMGALGWQMWTWVRTMGRNQLLLDAGGAHFRLSIGERGRTEQVSMPWQEISSVTRSRKGNIVVYAVAAGAS